MLIINQLMKNLIFYIVLFISCLINSSCNKAKEDSRAQYSNHDTKVSISDKNESVLISQVVDSVQMIPLETSSKCLVSRIKQIIVFNERIFVCSEGSYDRVHMFDLNGNFICEVGTIGKSPGEFLEVTQMGIDEFRNRMFILDLRSRRINYYSREGEFLESTKTKVLFRKMQFITENKIALYANSGYNPSIKDNQNMQLIITDRKFKPISFDFPLPCNRKIFNYSNNLNLTKQNGIVHLFPMFSDSIFTVSDDSLSLKYTIDNGVKQKLKVNTTMTTNDFKKLSRKYNRFDGFFSDLTKYALFAYFAKDVPEKQVLLDKETGKSRTIQTKSLSSWVDVFFSRPFFSYDDKLVSALNSYHLCVNRKDLVTIGDIPASVVQKLEALSENSNPVIMIYHMKKTGGNKKYNTQ